MDRFLILDPTLKYKIFSAFNPLKCSFDNLIALSRNGYQNIKPNQLKALRSIVDFLFDKGFIFANDLFPKSAQNVTIETRDRQLYDSLMAIINYFDGTSKNENELKKNIEKTPLWSLKQPVIEIEHHDFQLESFKYKNINENKFNALRDYFIKVSKLFNDPKKCLQYLKPIDGALKSISFDSVNLTPSGYLANGSFFSPCPPSTYIGIKKHNLLRKALIDFFTNEQKNHPEINILSSGEFWDTFGFIDPAIANGLVKKGELFWEKRYPTNSNAHGSATHPSQIEIMAMAHLSGECPFPKDTTLKDILAAMVSDDITHEGEHIWTMLFDSVNASFHCPMFVQATLMSDLGKSICPTLCDYTRDSFWQHYMVTSQITKHPIEVLIFLDIYEIGLFSNVNFLNFSNLLERYHEKSIQVEKYTDAFPTLFKKRYPQKQECVQSSASKGMDFSF